MPFFQISLSDKSRGVTYTSDTFGTYKEAISAYTEFTDSEFMSNFFDITISKITEKVSFTSTPSEFSTRPLAGMYYETTDTKNRFILHIMSTHEHDLVEQVMTTYGIPVTYEHPGAYFMIPYLHTIQRLGAEDLVTADPAQFDDIAIVSSKPAFTEHDASDSEYVPADETEDDEEFTDDNLTGFFYQKYGKGYLLTCSKDHPCFGESYFHEGWWNHNAQGWFFKSEYKSHLKSLGAVRITRDGSARKRLDFSESSAGAGASDETLEGMVFFTYGRGFIMKAPKNDSRWGTKYFHDGWWNAKAEGWFFRKDSDTIQRLTDLGAKHLTSKKSSSRSSR